MKEANMTGLRGPQILSLLAEHGTLSVRGLRVLLKPTIEARRLREVLKRLQDDGFVIARHKRLFGGAAVFYQVNQDHDGWLATLEKTGLSPTTIRPPYYRHQDALHSEDCAIWSQKIRCAIPGVQLLRDHQFAAHATTMRKLMTEANERELRPDMVLLMPKSNAAGEIAVAVEIEKSPKTESRLIRKLKKYAGESLLDGLIYICDHESISERLRQIYHSPSLSRVGRVKHYGNNFFLFSHATARSSGSDLALHNAALQSVSLAPWMQHLAATEKNLRRDHTFPCQPPAAGS